MVEVEMKFSEVDFPALEQKLLARGAKPLGVRQDADQYFNAPDRDFAITDEALRLRRTGNANTATYKGPKRDAQTKTRTEIEVPLAEGDEPAASFVQLVTHLGYRPVATVRKQRHRFHLEKGGFPLEITLDEVEGVGRFAELEIVATEERLDAARTILLELAADLGLTASERRSYLELFLSCRPEKAS